MVLQSLGRLRLFSNPWTAAGQAPLSFAISGSLLKLMSTELVMPSNHLILCRPLLLPPSMFPSIKVFSNKSALRIRWPQYWSFSFSISPSNKYSGLISFRIRASLVAQSLPAVWETPVRALGQEDPLEKERATHSSILAWEIPWTEEPGRLQSIGSQKVGHN